MEKTMEESRQKFQCLRRQLDNAELSWMQHLIRVKERDIAEMVRKQTEIEDQMRQVKGVIASCKVTLKETNALKLLSFQSKHPDAKDLEPGEILLPPVVHFVPLEYRLPAYEQFLGKLKVGKKRSLNIEGPEKSLSRRGQLFTENMLEKAIVKSIDASAKCLVLTAKKEMLAYDNQEITIYNEQFEISHTIELEFEVYDMTFSLFHDIIVTDSEGSRVIEISRSGEISSLLETWPLILGGICVNDEANIVLGLHAGYGTPPVKLVVCSSDAFEVVQEIENDASGDPLFRNFILQVKQNGNGDYVVSDLNRIVCVSRKGLYRWEYMLDFHNANGIACDSYNNVIVAQRYGNTISVLDSEGNLISTLLTEEDGILQPLTLAIDSHGFLWIGQEDQVKVVKYIK